MTCQNCRTYRVAYEHGEPFDPNRNHWMLPLPGLPPMPSWPPEHGQDIPDNEA